MGTRVEDGRMIALDAELTLPDVFPARIFDGYVQTYVGRGENPRLEEGYLVADFTLEETVDALLDAELHTIGADFWRDDWEHFEDDRLGHVAVLVKAELRGVTIVGAPALPAASS